MTTKLKALIAALCSLFLVACEVDTEFFPAKGGSSGDLRIVAATELKDMEPLIQQAAKDLGFSITMEYPDGTIANSLSLKAGEFDGQFDATWFATNKYVDLYEAGDKLGTSTSIATSPVAFGVRQDTARELGWTDKQPTWAEITDAVKGEKFNFGMTDPARSNSGFSALVSVATAMADTGAALQAADVTRVEGQLKEFFAGQNLTSGSSGWLEEAFISDPNRTDAIVNYESVLLQSKKQGRADIHVVVPADGVVTADYPLAPLTSPRQADAAAKTEQLATWLRQHNQQIVQDTQRRPVDPGVALTAEQQANSLIELPFPARKDVAGQLVAAFNDQLRAPGQTVFVLDKSGSMRGERIDSLHAILNELVDGTAHTATGPVGLRDREDISIIGFNGKVDAPQHITFTKADAGSSQQIKDAINSLQPGGQTAVYDALRAAYSQFDPAAGGERIPSIVLMSDGASNVGDKYADFERFHKGLSPEQKRIPVFIILYGESNVKEMDQLARLTGGKTFDATKGDLASAFKEIRGYQ